MLWLKKDRAHRPSKFGGQGQGMLNLYISFYVLPADAWYGAGARFWGTGLALTPRDRLYLHPAPQLPPRKSQRRSPRPISCLSWAPSRGPWGPKEHQIEVSLHSFSRVSSLSSDMLPGSFPSAHQQAQGCLVLKQTERETVLLLVWLPLASFPSRQASWKIIGTSCLRSSLPNQF